MHDDLQEFEYLFVEKRERVELMNDTAPHFFGHLQQTLWSSMLLQLCRLTDPGKSMGKPNLSLHLLLADTTNGWDLSRKQRAEELVKIATNHVTFARDWRNRRIAHKDLSAALKAKPCATATLSDVRTAAKVIAQAMDALDPNAGQTHWTPSRSARGASALLSYLEEGLINYNRKREACKSGDIPLSEFWPSSKRDT